MDTLMIFIFAISFTCLIASISALTIGCLAYSKITGLMNSTHQIQFIDPSTPGQEQEQVQSFKKYDQSLKEEYADLEDDLEGDESEAS